MQVGIEFPDYLLHCGAMIPYHLSPPLGVQHCSYSRCMSIKICHNNTPLYYDPAITEIEIVTVAGLISPKMCSIVDKILVLFIGGATGLPDRSSRVFPLPVVSSVSTSSITTFGSDSGSWASCNGTWVRWDRGCAKKEATSLALVRTIVLHETFLLTLCSHIPV